ncbi:choline kinase-like protein [Encephalitozoon romaleae SJ-2008]|uniref:ethanolamine kinase n=1 Tax=Encephalitozoon romaleae (strain SJ-2008) TaxID=1178016 RepID=I7AQM4_ENCRO|nr:choline kinase-like protein [Encephalitozoon romaleae SJ-2008]AFN82622.1 choline kinase-like protein [Encephalitozoon romaleae SJ-2008]
MVRRRDGKLCGDEELLSKEPGVDTTAIGGKQEPGVPQEVIKDIRMCIGGEPSGMSRIRTAYSNVVYMFEVNGSKYIYKEFREFDEQDEMINRIVGGERVVASNHRFRIEKRLEGRHGSIREDLRRIAPELRKFHDTHVEGIRSYEELVESMMVKCIREMVAGSGRGDMSLSSIEEKMKRMRASDAGWCSGDDCVFWILMKARDRVFEVPKGGFKAVMCHNDLQPGNILVSKDEVVLIDFEFAAMGSPVIEIANLFCEAGYDYSRYVFLEERFPSAEEQMEFVREYMGGDESWLEIVRLVPGAMAYSHFLWYLWAWCNKRCGSSEVLTTVGMETHDCHGYMMTGL